MLLLFVVVITLFIHNAPFAEGTGTRFVIPKVGKGDCQLAPDASVNYYCINAEDSEDSRTCYASEPNGTTVTAECQKPNYYSPSSLPLMRCIDGIWNYIARCIPECGRVTPVGTALLIGGTPNREIPWHAGIYRKSFNPYMQICGGSLISTKIIISAAHCFWTELEKQLPASQYAVAVGKTYRPWNHIMDIDVQKSDVKEIHIPNRYQGAAANFQDDIAILIVSEEFTYKINIRPVCINFDIKFENRQLQNSAFGKLAGWGSNSAEGRPSLTLIVKELPYVELDVCLTNTPPTFRPYITSDKMCAGSTDSNNVCKGDGGGGLAFPVAEMGIERYYLRGVGSTAPINDNFCNTANTTLFTQLKHHESFIKKYWTEE